MSNDGGPSPANPSETYTVLARRYRPQQFEDFVGQEAIIRSLKAAIEQNRVAHAYLFTGARGVGKTSMARTFARALNCVEGPTIHPCCVCDQCQAIAAGQDVDVLEIDGASNNKIEEIRELRQTVHYRPTRSRFKIYLIDEVHMVTQAAFNALLKTLEEPPPHVKFLFATTEVQKIPITILSRCQRFDFSGIDPERITQRLREIVASEGKEADDEALEIVARRAGGSMRDSQSLLDQLLSYGGDRLTAADVHRSIGTANEERVRALATAILDGSPAVGLELVETSVGEGVQLGEWIEQALDYFRDLMVLGFHRDAPLVSMPERLRAGMMEQGEGRSAETLLEIMDLLASCRARMKTSTFARTLLEMTVVRLCRLDKFLNLQEAMHSGPAAATATVQPMTPVATAGAQKKNASNGDGTASAVLAAVPRLPRPVEPAAPARPMFEGPVNAENASTFWNMFLGRLPDPVLVNMLGLAERVECRKSNEVTVVFRAGLHNSCRSYAEAASKQIEDACRELSGRLIALRYESGAAAVDAGTAVETLVQLRDLALRDPLVQRAELVLGAKVLQVDRAVRRAAPIAEPERDEP